LVPRLRRGSAEIARGFKADRDAQAHRDLSAPDGPSSRLIATDSMSRKPA
jgi:hypothetical protein